MTADPGSDLITGRRHLTGVQYADDSNLLARQSIYVYQRPRIDIYEWVLSLADLSGDERFVDLGCGNGRYLAALARRGHAGPLVGVDLSIGMLRSVAFMPAPALVVGDVSSLPLLSGAVDVALVAHVLQHVADAGVALGELRRVVRPGTGRALVVTNGADHLDELDALLKGALEDLGRVGRLPLPFRFPIESAEVKLRAAFSDVELYRAGSLLHITEPEPVLAYARSMSALLGPHPGEAGDEVLFDRIAARVTAVIAERGELAIRTSVGCFVCR